MQARGVDNLYVTIAQRTPVEVASTMIRAYDPSDGWAVCCTQRIFGASYAFEDQREVGLRPHPLNVVPSDSRAQAIHERFEPYSIRDFGWGHTLVLSAADRSHPCPITKGTPV